MQDMFEAYVRAHLTIRSSRPLQPSSSNPSKEKRVTIDIVRKCEAIEFRGNVNDDLAKVEYWLEHTQRILDETLCSPEDFLRCSVALLTEEAFQWWSTLTVVVPKERITC